MQALQLIEGQLYYRQRLIRPVPVGGEALIRVTLAGICSTDLEIVKGYAGFEGVLGHEFVGVVEACEDSNWIGQRVVGTINLGCGECDECLSQGEEHCLQRSVLGIHYRDGAFADYLTLPSRNLLAVPDGLADRRAVFVEPLAAALRIREQVTLRPSAKVAVVGPGRLGLLVGQVVALTGNDVTMIGRKTDSLKLPKQLGLQVGLGENFGDESFDLVIEATGNESGFAQSLRLVRARGTLLLKSTFAGKASLDLTKLVVGEINVIGSRCGPFAPALSLLRRNAVRVDELVEGEYTLKEGLSAFEHAARPGVRKILLRP